ncbi:hypothetical protein BH23ACT11_BH23ACT11_05830 [soil metagenome]
MWFAGVPVAGFASALVGGVAILHWGLVTPLFIVWPISMATAALLATIGVSWSGTFLAPDATRSQLLRTLAASEIVAVALAVLVLVAPAILPAGFLPPILLFAFAAVLIAIAASVATWRFRGPAEHVGLQVLVPLVLSALVLVFSLAGLTGLLGIIGLWEWTAMLLTSSVGLAAVALSVILIRRIHRMQASQTAKDAALTLGLVGLPAPVFFGAYYLAYVLNLTSG